MFQQQFRADESLLSNSNNNELLVIYLANGSGRRNTIFPPAQSRTVGAQLLRKLRRQNPSPYAKATSLFLRSYAPRLKRVNVSWQLRPTLASYVP